jgi:hypothetical protein
LLKPINRTLEGWGSLPLLLFLFALLGLERERECGNLRGSVVNLLGFNVEIVLTFCCVTCSLLVGSWRSVPPWAKAWFDGVVRSPFLLSLDLIARVF